MKIVIDMSEELYDYMKSLPYNTILEMIVLNGTSLPKGHGRLIDADELIKQLEVIANIEWNKQVGSSKGLEDAIDIVDDTSAIIEADKELEQPDKCKFFKDADCCYPIEDCINCPNHKESD